MTIPDAEKMLCKPSERCNHSYFEHSLMKRIDDLETENKKLKEFVHADNRQLMEKEAGNKKLRESAEKLAGALKIINRTKLWPAGESIEGIANKAIAAYTSSDEGEKK